MEWIHFRRMWKLNYLSKKQFTLSLMLLGLCASSTASAAARSWSDSAPWDEDAQVGSAGKTTAERETRRQRRNRDGTFTPFTPGSHNFSVGIGQIFLMGDLADSYSDSLGGQIHYTYGVSSMFSFDSNVGYSDHSDGSFSLFTALAGLRTNLNWYDKVIPYVVFGLGFYRPSYKILPGESLSPFLFGLHMGPGVDLQLTDRFFFGASLSFHNIFNNQKSTSIGSKEVGGTYISFLLHLGTTF